MQTIKKILIISSWNPTKQNPLLGNFVEYQAKLLSTKYQVIFVRLLEKNYLENIDNHIENLTYINIYYKKTKNPILNYWNKRKVILNHLHHFSDIDIIHAHVSFPDGWIFRLLKKKLKKPLILTEHASYYASTKKWSARMNYEIRKTVNSSDVVASVSNFLSKDILKRFPNLLIYQLGNSVNFERFKINNSNNKEFVFLHVSTLDEVKQFDIIFQSFVQLMENKSNVKLIVVSDGNYSHYQQRTKELKLIDKIHFFGPIEHHEIQNFYHFSDCLIMNSKYETFSIVIAEAWTCGLPVISTSVGIAYQMDNKLGIQTNGSVESIVIAMEKVLKNKFDKNIIREKALQYSDESFLKQIELIYDTVCCSK